MSHETFAELEAATDTLAPPRRVVVIDDDMGQVDVLRFRLGQQGYQVSTAHTVTDGRQLVRAELPDAVLLDVALPDGCGLELARELSDAALTGSIPVIIVSGIDRPDIVRQTRSMGGSFYVRKPYDPSVLLLVVEHAIAEAEKW